MSSVVPFFQSLTKYVNIVMDIHFFLAHSQAKHPHVRSMLDEGKPPLCFLIRKSPETALKKFISTKKRQEIPEVAFLNVFV